jgi:transcriptional regulator with XRE-family HTH domain
MSGDFLGARVRFFRVQRGFTQRTLATLADLPQGRLSPLEAGLRPVDTPATLGRLAAALRVSVADLTGQPFTPGDDRQIRARTAIPDVRAALTGLTCADLPEVPSRTLVELDDGVRRLMRSRRSCDYAEAVHLISGLVTDLGSAAYRLTNGRARRASLRLLVLATYHATLVLRYLGDVDLPLAAARCCHDAARELAEPEFTGLADYALLLAVPAGGHARRYRLAVAAIERLPVNGKPAVRQAYGMLHLAGAGAAASAGDPACAAAHLAEAADLAGRLGGDPPDGGFAELQFGPTNVAQWRVSVALSGGAHGTAVELARLVDPAAVASPSRRAAFHIDVGSALAAGRGDDAGAVAQFVAAERIAPYRAQLSPVVRDTVGVLLRRARSRAGGGQLRGLATRLGAD